MSWLEAKKFDRAIADELRTATHACRETWENSPSPPEATIDGFENANFEQDDQTGRAESTTVGPISQTYEISEPLPRLSRSQSNDLTGDEREVLLGTPDPPFLDQLRGRGTGEYHCQLGLDCDKGGVVNGQLRLFKRNCDYRCELSVSYLLKKRLSQDLERMCDGMRSLLNATFLDVPIRKDLQEKTN